MCTVYPRSDFLSFFASTTGGGWTVFFLSSRARVGVATELGLSQESFDGGGRVSQGLAGGGWGKEYCTQCITVYTGYIYLSTTMHLH